MERFNKCKLRFHGFRCSFHRIIPISRSLFPQFQPNSAISTKCRGFTSSSHVSQIVGLDLQMRKKIGHSHPYSRTSNRFSSTLSYISDLLVIGLIVKTTIHCFNSVKVLPYINRKGFLPFTASKESGFGNLLLRMMEEKEYKGKILPATHPYSLRACSIAQSLIDTLQRDLELEKVSRVAYHGHAQNSKDSATESWGDFLEKQVQEVMGWRKDIWHLEEFKWEVVVVNNSDPNAGCLPGGKIVVHTGLLDHFCDTGVSAIIAHEAGHAVAQHGMERFNYAFLNRIDNLIGLSKWVNFMTLDDFKKRGEIEADYISLLLMASAGYHPLVVLQMYQKLVDLRYGKGGNVPTSVMERLEMLSRPHVIEKAWTVYLRKTTGSK